MPFIYCEKYTTSIGEHVFPVQKYRLLYEKLLADGLNPEEVIKPVAPTHEQLLLVHTPAYLNDLDLGLATQRTMWSELPITEAIIGIFKLAAGGTLVAMQEALRNRFGAFHIGGGFHHAFAARAEGFCYINDLALAANAFLEQKPDGQVQILDLDLHQGNGTAHIFGGEPRVFTLSMHQDDIYPVKEKSSLDVPLYRGLADEAYLDILAQTLETVQEQQPAPNLILYQAGADPYYDDQLGSLALTKAGLRQRDNLVFAHAARCQAPIVVTLGGGYARKIADTVDIHYGTALAYIAHVRSGGMTEI